MSMANALGSEVIRAARKESWSRLSKCWKTN